MMSEEYKIASSIETIEKIINDGCSISRFGDGEFKCIMNKDLYFQKYNEELTNRLKKVLNSNEEKLLIGLPLALNIEFAKREYVEFAKEFWLDWVDKNIKFLDNLLDKDRQYYSAQISRFYIDYEDKSRIGAYVKKLKEIWKGRDIIIIEGEKSRLGVGNDLFDEAKSIKRILRTCRKCI